MKELSRRDFLKVAAVTGAATMLPGCKTNLFGSKKPNIIYLFADQMRASAMGCMGNSEVITPHLDKLASQGVLFTNAISAQPVCSPYRANLMTGRFGHSTGVVHNDLRLPDNELLISEIWKKEGYSTGYIGKWHLGGYRENPVDKVNRRGWDYWAVRNCDHGHMRPAYWLNDATEPITVKDAWEPDVQTDLAIEYIKKNKDNPFAMMVSYGPPHNPYKAPQKYLDMYKDVKLKGRLNDPEVDLERLKNYYAMVTSLDDCVGRIVESLEKAGIADNTILCFTSDHGDMLGSQGHKLKQRPWEESINIPFIMRYPNKIKPAKKDYLFSSVDVMPTLLDFCGATIPKNVDGQSLADLLIGKTKKEQDELFLFNTHAGAGPKSDWRGIRTKEWVYAFHAFGDWIMYDLKNDPNELNNLIGNPKYKAKRDELKNRLDNLRKKYKENIELVGESPPPVIELPK